MTRRLHDRLPAHVRQRDAELGGPLADLLALVDVQLEQLREDLDQLYDDQFIETCAEWVVPYIGDLLGIRARRAAVAGAVSPRAEVAHTIGYRRRKGTVAVLRQLAVDITGWPARAQEFYRQLAVTQSFVDLHPERTGPLDLRRTAELARLRGPLAAAPRTADVRPGGRYNIPEIGVYLWRLRALPLRRVEPLRVDAARYLFDPLGQSTPLFARLAPDLVPGDEPALAQLPAPISRRDLHDRLTDYYGDDRSLAVRIAGKLVPAAAIDVCDLSDRDNDTWARGARKDRVGIDPELGRVVLGFAPAGPVEVDLHVGGAAELGGGQYERDPGGDAPAATRTLAVGDPLAPALAASATGGVLELQGSGTRREALALTLARDARLTVRAADGQRPLIVPAAAIDITAEAGAELVLEGLVIAGALRVPAASKLARLVLRHCTLVPGLTRDRLTGGPTDAAAPSLVVAAAGVAVELEACITGPLRLVATATLRVRGSIVDAHRDSGLALAAPDGGPGAALDLAETTVRGRVDVVSAARISNAIVLAAADPEHPDVPSVQCERRQIGCVRYSWIPLDARVPRRFHCLPTPEDPAVRPRFTSLRFGAPGYAQLGRRCPDAVVRGADDESEIGVFHDLFQPHRELDLRARLAEYLRLGLHAELIFVT